MKIGRIGRVGVVGVALALALTGCVGEGSDSDNGAVEILGDIGGPEGKQLEKALEEISKETGIKINYQAPKDFATVIRSRVQGGNAPDIALFPQPGLLQDVAAGGAVTPLEDAGVDVKSLESSLVPGILDATKKDGKTLGAPIRLAVKSLVWYPKKAFEKAGYQVPKTHAELIALTDRIKAGGTTPWCIGIESEDSTGWVATDWIEDYVLRSAGPEAYDQWTSHQIPFNDPKIKKAAEYFQQIALTPGNVLGGNAGILNTPFGKAANPMFDEKPGCYFNRISDFITSLFPDKVKADLSGEVGVFVLPPVEGGAVQGNSIVGGGDLASLMNPNNDNAKKVLQKLTASTFGTAAIKDGGWISPHKSFDASQYPSETTKQIATLALSAQAFRFDGSDLMPAEVGAGTFWKGMVAWISGQQNLNQTFDGIESSWPKK